MFDKYNFDFRIYIKLASLPSSFPFTGPPIQVQSFANPSSFFINPGSFFINPILLFINPGSFFIIPGALGGGT